ncbi:hypothetical protein D9613_005646 [Agrocybe pediades]|uniref:RNA polymerase II-associated protein 3 n=1 Tax=Agrocybe pediades TaxID=84607 RepID=A0A8H4QU84_9AGAR|nr:hypothetical protein D9613_005646 [Agrocybe pediades]
MPDAPNKKAQALAAKEKGNQAFKASDFPSAIGHYTSAHIADPTDPTFPLNRAAAYLKLNKYQDAERDCTTVLRLTPGGKNVKALFRRGQARMGLGRLEDAEKDFSDALTLEPANVSAKQELNAAKELLRKEKERRDVKGKSKVPESVPTTTNGATQPPPPKRRRVPIRIVGEVEGSISSSAPGASSSSSSSSKQPLITPLASSETDSAMSTASETNKQGFDDAFLEKEAALFEDELLRAIPNNESSTPTPKPMSNAQHTKVQPADEPTQPSSPSFSPPPTQASASTSTSTSTPAPNGKEKPKPTPGLKYTSSPSTSSSSTTASGDKETFQKAKQARDASKPSRVGGGIFKATGESVIIREATAETGSESKVEEVKEEAAAATTNTATSPAVAREKVEKAQSPVAPVSMKASSPAPAAAVPGTGAGADVVTPKKPAVVPQTLFEFSRMWDNALGGQKKREEGEVVCERWGLVCSIPPPQIPAIFKTNLEPSLLVSILDIFLKVLKPLPEHETTVRAQVLSYLHALSAVPRFGTLLLFLSKPEKVLAREVWALLGVSGPEGVQDDKVRGVWKGIWG